MDLGGALDDSAAVPDDLVGRLQFGQRRAGLGEQIGGVDRDGGVGGEGGEQGDLFAFEDAHAAVGGEEHPDDAAAEQQRHPEDGDQALVLDARVDGPGVLEPGVVEVAVGHIGARGLGDEPAEPLAHAEPQLLEARRDRAVGDPHIGVAGGRVVEGQIRDLGAQERAGAPHDGLEHRVEVAQPGQVMGGLEERGQLGLAAPAPLQFAAYPQREQLGALQCGEPARRRRPRRGRAARPLVRLRGGAAASSSEVGVPADHRAEARGRLPAGGGAARWAASR